MNKLLAVVLLAFAPAAFPSTDIDGGYECRLRFPDTGKVAGGMFVFMDKGYKAGLGWLCGILPCHLTGHSTGWLSVAEAGSYEYTGIDSEGNQIDLRFYPPHYPGQWHNGSAKGYSTVMFDGAKNLAEYDCNRMW